MEDRQKHIDLEIHKQLQSPEHRVTKVHPKSYLTESFLRTTEALLTTFDFFHSYMGCFGHKLSPHARQKRPF